MISFDDINEQMDAAFARARQKSPEDLERISNDHIYLSMVWEEKPPRDYPDQLLEFLRHAPECIDCMDYWSSIHRKRLLEEQDIRNYADRIATELRNEGIDIDGRNKDKQHHD